MMIPDAYKAQFAQFNSKPIGRGGYKEVFLAEHPNYGRVVVKVFTRGVDDRAMREIHVLEDNSFYHVPALYQTEEMEYNGHMTMATIEQFVEGTGLRQLIASGHCYSFQEICTFLEQALTFVDDIWSKRIVHRDIKPENIIVGQDGQFYFIDFGAARDLESETLTNTANAMPCTYGYAAPEVLRNEAGAIDSRADLFSVGVVAYEMASGKNPYAKQARSALEMALNTLTITPVQLSIPGDSQRRLVGLISSMMNRSRLSRPKDPQQALAFLRLAAESYERR